nr:tetratricopeptide repeat protein [Thiorhodococcus mannitoliphagus]
MHEALEHFARAVLLDETRPEAHLGLGFCYANLGDDRRAIRHYDACLERGFGSRDYPHLCYEYDGSDEQTWTVEINLDQVLLWRADCWLSLDRIEPARHDLERLSAPDAPDTRAEIAVLRAKILLAENQPDATQRELSRALGWDPEHPEAHYLRGRVHECHGRFPEAVKAYARAMRLDPEAPEFRVSRARVYLALGEKRKAEADLRAAKALLSQQLPQLARTAEIAALWDQLVV